MLFGYLLLDFSPQPLKFLTNLGKMMSENKLLELANQTDFSLGARTYFFLLTQYGTAFTIKWLQAVWWHKRRVDCCDPFIFCCDPFIFCFETCAFAAVNRFECSWERIWYSPLLFLVLVCWKMKELNFCVTIRLNPILIKRLMCQVQLLVPFQHRLKVGEQRKTGMTLMLK